MRYITISYLLKCYFPTSALIFARWHSNSKAVCYWVSFTIFVTTVTMAIRADGVEYVISPPRRYSTDTESGKCFLTPALMSAALHDKALDSDSDDSDYVPPTKAGMYSILPCPQECQSFVSDSSSSDSEAEAESNSALVEPKESFSADFEARKRFLRFSSCPGMRFSTVLVDSARSNGQASKRHSLKHLLSNRQRKCPRWSKCKGYTGLLVRRKSMSVLCRFPHLLLTGFSAQRSDRGSRGLSRSQ